jgi:hypothetical protein
MSSGMLDPIAFRDHTLSGLEVIFWLAFPSNQFHAGTENETRQSRRDVA